MNDKIIKLNYIFIIWLLITSFIGGLAFFNNDAMINIVSISSALISIIIGVLAIFISLYQSLSEKTSIQKLDESANRIQFITRELEKFDFEKVKTDLNSIRKKVDTVFSTENSDYNDMNFDEDTYKTMIISSRVNQVMSYFIFKFNEAGKETIKVADITEIQVNLFGKYHEERYVGGTLQYFHILNMTGALKTSNEIENEFRILKFNDNYQSAIRGEVEKIEERYPNINKNVIEKTY
ncbi:hypothetical protein IMZ31_17130 [Pontibacillus sp. ALD_SL1]|uniref:hypothetical protein n=1 Tax=Pontibacillus sp. ALD_SL1 TaxID=2777185 RepID=UPI001A969C94|nr:hypothetical protein [Pontibacillus sp. ALD_SL1]QSS99765.1 hypothetical protein IMZ31_17130 [Pontibacillus sp. ALD_SL1]